MGAFGVCDPIFLGDDISSPIVFDYDWDCSRACKLLLLKAFFASEVESLNRQQLM
jgi:hypothetical protein